METKTNKKKGVGQDWVCFDADKEYGREEDEVLWPHQNSNKNIDTWEDRRQVAKGQTWFQNFKRLDKTGHDGCIKTGD